MVDSILSGNPDDSHLLQKYVAARKIYLSLIKRSYVEAAMIASRDLEQISAILEIPVDILETYRDVFFDVADFDRLSLLEVIGDIENPEAKSMALWSISQGLEFISFRLGKSSSISPIQGLEDLYQMACWKAKEALFSGNSSEGSKQATVWVKLSMELARLLKAWVMDSDAAKQDIELALAKIEPSFDGYQELLGNDAITIEEVKIPEVTEAEIIEELDKLRAEPKEDFVPTDTGDMVFKGFDDLDLPTADIPPAPQLK